MENNERYTWLRSLCGALAAVAVGLAASACESSTAADPSEDGRVNCAAFETGPTVGPGEPGPTGFPVSWCSPRDSGAGAYQCCSDDPAAPGGALPAYVNKQIAGETPYFAGVNNDVGRSGLCAMTADIPAGSGLGEAGNCPIACNPTWEPGEVAAVCGGNRVCCQTRELKPEDCVLDGDVWRPVRGSDIADGLTRWAPGEHATHQDPGGQTCRDGDGNFVQDCAFELSVADQRGLCMALGAGQLCPLDRADYLDACEQINMGLINPPGGDSETG